MKTYCKCTTDSEVPCKSCIADMEQAFTHSNLRDRWIALFDTFRPNEQQLLVSLLDEMRKVCALPLPGAAGTNGRKSVDAAYDTLHAIRNIFISKDRVLQGVGLAAWRLALGARSLQVRGEE